MDSWSKSAIAGRIAGPVFWIIAAILYFGFNIVIDEETSNKLIETISILITSSLAIWGTVAPVLSKYRQVRQSDKK